ncbi:hypothetical protein QA641_16440 [Bradyrhizobium sp. CB1650]|uniref:hypothetical protein n=1 Tax=Bradyrhizobium sp. CB1650 TaxID=3039153 RepID=UPI002434E16B|nr:hypothetical protein [Bradyrhizobium sp. CB1650]WGD55318.1 hypothetical protein QA641_16440 [Bradyrhizobium sp. CB1650]
MSRQMHFLVQSFDPTKGEQLKAGAPIVCRTEESARRTAERLAVSKAGVVAFSTSSDAETGDYDDQPIVFFRAGRVPSEFDSMP